MFVLVTALTVELEVLLHYAHNDYRPHDLAIENKPFIMIIPRD